MVRESSVEMSIEEWATGLDNLRSLGCDWIAVYGAEPMIDVSRLTSFVRLVSARGIGMTVITNGVLAKDSDWVKLAEAGLDSVTMSYDGDDEQSVGDGYARSKGIVAKRKMLHLKELGLFRDLQLTMTLTKQNLQNLVPLIEWATPKGIWVSFDFLHWKRDDVSDSKCPDKSVLVGQTLDATDYDRVVELVKRLRVLKADGALLFQNDAVFDRIEYRYDDLVGLSWKCGIPALVSVDCDGTMRCCDDMKMHETWNVKDLTVERWNSFVDAWKRSERQCKGCFWTTHMMSVDMLQSDTALDYFAHRETT